MSFDCSKVVPKKCHGDCCRFVPIPKSLWEDQKKNIVRKVLYLYNHDENSVMPITKDLRCPFLKDDYGCAIYSARPWVCRVYGMGGADCLSCPYLKPNGSKRNHVERDRLVAENEKNLLRIAENINKVGKMLSEGKTPEEIAKIMPKQKEDKAEMQKIVKALIKGGAINVRSNKK